MVGKGVGIEIVLAILGIAVSSLGLWYSFGAKKEAKNAKEAALKIAGFVNIKAMAQELHGSSRLLVLTSQNPDLNDGLKLLRELTWMLAKNSSLLNQLSMENISELFKRIQNESKEAYNRLLLPLATLGDKGHKATIDHMNDLQKSCYDIGLLVSELAGALDTYIIEKDYT